jgi:hypothetical protein
MKARSPSLTKIATTRLESKQTLAKIVKTYTKPFTYENKHEFFVFIKKFFHSILATYYTIHHAKFPLGFMVFF